MIKKKNVKYFCPTRGCVVEDTIDLPDPINVKPVGDLNKPPKGSVRFAGSNRSLGDATAISDLVTPLTWASRQQLVEALSQALTFESEQEAVAQLAGTWHINDDRTLKLIARLIGEVGHQRGRREYNMNKREQLLHEKALLVQAQARLKQEIRELLKDVEKLVGERDEALRSQKNVDTKGRVYLESQLVAFKSEDQKLRTKLTAVQTEFDVFKRDSARRIETALTEYETQVMGKLVEVAADHKVAVDENNTLKGSIKGLREQLARLNEANTQVKKEIVMNEAENDAVEALSSGDEVYCKISGEGPFVLVTQVEEGIVKYANPVPGTKNHFHAGEVPIHRPWLVRDRTGSMQCLPAPILTKSAPKSKFSFGGIKSLVTSDVTAKIFQAAIWISMLTLLYMQRG